MVWPLRLESRTLPSILVPRKTEDECCSCPVQTCHWICRIEIWSCRSFSKKTPDILLCVSPSECSYLTSHYSCMGWIFPCFDASARLCQTVLRFKHAGWWYWTHRHWCESSDPGWPSMESISRCSSNRQSSSNRTEAGGWVHVVLQCYPGIAWGFWKKHEKPIDVFNSEIADRWLCTAWLALVPSKTRCFAFKSLRAASQRRLWNMSSKYVFLRTSSCGLGVCVSVAFLRRWKSCGAFLTHEAEVSLWAAESVLPADFSKSFCQSNLTAQCQYFWACNSM